MKNIAIIGSLNYHLECISFLLEVFQNDSVYIYINDNTDIFKWIDYYRLLYKFQVIYNSFSSKIIHDHDLVFKLTSNDDCLDHENIIENKEFIIAFIKHFEADVKKWQELKVV